MHDDKLDLDEELPEDWQAIYTEDEEIDSLIEGEILIHEAFKSQYLKHDRDIFVYLPPSYHDNEDQSYPVIYANDGNNIFISYPSPVGMEWGIESEYESLLLDDYIEECIIVGIANTENRDSEYTPIIDKEEECGGLADSYLDFLEFELIPFIEKEYRIKKGRKFRAFLGSSLGGLISLYAAFARPQLFNAIASMSPSLWWADRYMEEVFLPNQGHPDTRIYIDMGGLEGEDEEECEDGLLDSRAVVDILLDLGYTMGEDLIYHEDLDAEHNEICWGSRVHLPLMFFFGNNEVADEESD